MSVFDKTTNKIYGKMRMIHFFFHPFRNNPRNREYAYNLLIDSVGVDNWNMLGDSEKKFDCYKQSWKAAKNDFDELYGLIKAWTMKGTKDIVKILVTEAEAIKAKKEEKENKEEQEE